MRRPLTVNLSKEYLSEIPIVKRDSKGQKLVIKLVDEILAATALNDYSVNAEVRARVEELERQVDVLVYELYGLSEAEIKIVEAE